MRSKDSSANHDDLWESDPFYAGLAFVWFGVAMFGANWPPVREWWLTLWFFGAPAVAAVFAIRIVVSYAIRLGFRLVPETVRRIATQRSLTAGRLLQFSRPTKIYWRRFGLVVFMLGWVTGILWFTNSTLAVTGCLAVVFFWPWRKQKGIVGVSMAIGALVLIVARSNAASGVVGALGWAAAGWSLVRAIRSGSPMASWTRPVRLWLVWSGVLFAPTAIVHFFFPVWSHHPETLGESILASGPDLAESTFYGLRWDPPRDRLYFSDKRNRRIGWIHLGTGETRWSEQLRGEPERLASATNTGTISTFLKGPYNPTLTMDSETLEARHYCHLGAYIDITPAWREGELIGLVESGKGEVHFFDPLTCRNNIQYMNQMFPYDINCVGDRRTCFITSWWMGSWTVRLRPSEDEWSSAYDILRVGPLSMGSVIDEQRRRLYISRPFANVVDVIDIDSFQRVDRWDAPDLVRAMVLIPERNWLVAASYLSGEVHVIDVGSGKAVARFRTASTVRDAVWNPVRHTLYFAAGYQITAVDLSDIQRLVDSRHRE